MQDDSPGPRRPRRRRRLAIRLAAVAAALLALWGAWVIFGNWYIRERLPGRLNERPDSFLAQWEHAETWWPGSVSVTGLRLRKRAAGVEWELRMDAARARFGLIPLLFEHLSVNRMRGEGMGVRVRFVPGSTPGREEGSPFAPPIAGFPDPPLQAPSSPLPPPPPEDERWTYHFDDLDVRDVREAWIGPFRFQGAARVATSMDFKPGESIDVGDFRFVAESGGVSVGEDVLASPLIAEVTLDLDRFDMRERPPMAVFDEMSARVRTEAELHDVQLPRTSFPRIPWLGFGGGVGRASVDLRMEDGSLAPGSRMRLDADDFTVEYPGYVVSGAAVVEGGVEGNALAADQARATATFREFTIRKGGSPSAHVRGEGFVAELRTTDLTLHRPLQTYEVEMTLPDSEIVDFSAYDESIPRPLRVHVLGGKGTIRGNLVVDQDGGHGTLGMDGTGVELRQGEDLMRLDMLLQARIPALDMDAGRFEFSGTELHVKNAELLNAASRRYDGWWADLLLDRLVLQRGADAVADLEASGTFRDTRPIVAILTRQRPLLKLVKPALLAPDAAVHARLKAGPDLVDLDELTITGEKLDVRGCLDLRGESSRGVFWLDGGMLSAGIKFMDGRRNVKPLAGAAWFGEHSPLCEDPAHLPPD